MDTYCPNCREMFESEPWEDGECPGCSEPYSWDCGPILNDDDDESYVYVVWVNY